MRPMETPPSLLKRMPSRALSTSVLRRPSSPTSQPVAKVMASETQLRPDRTRRRRSLVTNGMRPLPSFAGRGATSIFSNSIGWVRKFRGKKPGGRGGGCGGSGGAGAGGRGGTGGGLSFFCRLARFFFWLFVSFLFRDVALCVVVFLVAIVLPERRRSNRVEDSVGDPKHRSFSACRSRRRRRASLRFHVDDVSQEPRLFSRYLFM
mmetsp:Transcript_21591/g.66553  ORF Transcript_21591/g.66553 Transcript_21591/m.66553 type:complete len:206 (+) Transcript_21591:565-1182(+)